MRSSPSEEVAVADRHVIVGAGHVGRATAESPPSRPA